jgi:DNA-binding transcriptional ArsR family regulator
VRSELDQRVRYELSSLGEAIGDPSRAAMLVALLGGVALPASDLARAAGVAPSTATSHLHRLVRAGLVKGRAQGRHRYFELTGLAVADALEHLMALDERTRAGAAARRAPADRALALARTCYAHFAGRIAVAFWAHALEERWVSRVGGAVRLLPRGSDALGALLGTPAPLVGSTCLDWTERVPHVSGRLGVALCRALLEKAWVKRMPGTRALRVTVRGEEGLTALGIRWQP